MNETRIEARRYLISGRVQGVGYRYFTKRTAERIGLVGWVKNLPDGRVESYASGSGEQLQRFLKDLELGPGGGNVKSVEVSDVQASPRWTGFEICY